MSPIRFSVSKCHAYTVILILLLGVIIPTCSCYTKKKLVCIIIAAPSSYQPSSYSKYIKLNIYLFICSCLMSNAVLIKVYVDYCRGIDIKNLQGEYER